MLPWWYRCNDVGANILLLRYCCDGTAVTVYVTSHCSVVYSLWSQGWLVVILTSVLASWDFFVALWAANFHRRCSSTAYVEFAHFRWNAFCGWVFLHKHQANEKCPSSARIEPRFHTYKSWRGIYWPPGGEVLLERCHCLNVIVITTLFQ